MSEKKSKKEVMSLFRKLIYQENLLFEKTEKIKKSFGGSFESISEQLNFSKQFFESISSYNKALETRGFNHYKDPKYQLAKTNSRFTDVVLDLKKLNDEVRLKHNFPIITYTELRLLSLFYNLNDGDSIYLQEFMFLLCSCPDLFNYFQMVNQI